MYRFEKVFKNEPSALQQEIHRVLGLMAEIDDPADDKYKTLNEILIGLHKLNEAETSHKRLDRNQILIALTHLAGIAAIINYERLHAIFSKAAPMVLKPFK
jgi:hypothetical protein